MRSGQLRENLFEVAGEQREVGREVRVEGFRVPVDPCRVQHVMRLINKILIKTAARWLIPAGGRRVVKVEGEG